MSYASEEKKPRTILVGNPIPKKFFITKGRGESNLAIHAGSYHLALHEAGIERCNIMTYSSILPGIAQEINKNQQTIDKLTHGAELKTIMACADAEKGQRATAGIIFGYLFDKTTRKRYGGLVCEYKGHDKVESVEELLRANLDELYSNGYSERFTLKPSGPITNSFVPEKKFGTSLVALCFIEFELPVLEDKEGILNGAKTLELTVTE